MAEEFFTTGRCRNVISGDWTGENIAKICTFGFVQWVQHSHHRIVLANTSACLRAAPNRNHFYFLAFDTKRIINTTESLPIYILYIQANPYSGYRSFRSVIRKSNSVQLFQRSLHFLGVPDVPAVSAKHLRGACCSRQSIFIPVTSSMKPGLLAVT